MQFATLSETARWGVGIGLALASFVIGGGVMRAWLMRAKFLTNVDEYKSTFLTKVEFDAFCRLYEEWKTRVHEDFLQPFRQQTAALHEQTTAIARHANTLEHMRDDVGEMKEQINELVRHSLQRRVGDPPT